MKGRSLAIGTVIYALCLHANALTIDFDGIVTGNYVDEFYSSEGVFFENGNWRTVTDFGQTSQPNLAVDFSDFGSYMNVTGGFVDSLSFTYGTFSDATVSIYDGLNGTGNLLASVVLVTNDPYNFDLAQVNFAGVAYSVTTLAVDGASTFGWDDVTFTKSGGDVPVPATVPLVALGLAGLGWSRRKKA